MRHEPTKTSPPAPPSHRGSILRAVLAGVVGFIAASVFLAIVIPALIGLAKPPPRRAQCQSNLKQIALAHLQYTQDYDERMPLVIVHDTAISPERPLGWADALQPYLKSTEVFQCPAQADTDTTRQPNENGYTDYWYNARLAGVDRSSLRHHASILLNGEGNDGTDATDARYSLSELPTEWASTDSPVMRHLDGANYSYLDGHVKWRKHSSAIATQKPDGNNVTFAVR